MKIKLYILSLTILSLFFSGCFEDKSSTAFRANEEITIEGLEERYNYIVGGEDLVITPTAKSSYPGAEFSYMWEIYELNVQGYAPKLEKIAETKDLRYAPDKEAKGWMLLYSVTNTQTGYTKKVTANLDIATPYTRGWYVLKDDGTHTDLDLFATPDTICEVSSPMENVLLKNNARQLKGKGVKLTMGTRYKAFNPNSLLYINTNTLMVIGENDIAMTPISTMKIARDLTNITFDPLENPVFQSGSINAWDCYLICNGKLRGIYGMSENSGVFGYEKLVDDKASPYHLSKYIIPSSFAFIAFDNTSSSFFIGDAYGTYLTPTAKDGTSPIDVNNNNLECLYMGANVQYGELAYGVFKDKTTGIKGVYQLDAPYREPFKLTLLRELSADDRMANGEAYTVPLNDKFMYYAAEGKVWSYNLVNGHEKMEFEIPAGEKLEFIRNQSSTSKGEEGQYRYDYIIISTSMNGKYKLRMFTKNAGSLDPATPALEFEGNGTCRDVMYISPKAATAAIPYF